MKTCGCPSDTLSSLLIIRPADGAGMQPDFDAQGEGGLAERLDQVNRSVIKLVCSRRSAP
jgi:hypothetical protein